MKAGIYITGLAQSFVNESVEKYAERFVNEMNYAVTGKEYAMRTEKIEYTTNKSSTVAILFEKGTGKVIYKFYEFKYNEILTEKFNNHSLLVKNFLLLLLVFQKFPRVTWRMFRPRNYSRPYQAFYLFTILGMVALSVLFTLPALIGMAIDLFDSEALASWFSKSFAHWFTPVSEAIVSFTALILLVVPTANIVVSGIATEFVCANDYMQRGSQKQFLQGHLEKLVEYISEHEPDCRIHFHAYSFGCIVALDYVYPFGNRVTANTQKYCEAIITIGAPVELVESYYTGYYKDRYFDTGNGMTWINVYSINDALATNFRHDANTGDAEFGIPSPVSGTAKADGPEHAVQLPSSPLPVNVNYELITIKKHGFIDGLVFAGITAHGCYWDGKTEGQSCLRLVYGKMEELGLMG